MDDWIYFTMAGLIGLMILGDMALNSGAASLFLARKTLDLVQTLAFWRQ